MELIIRLQVHMVSFAVLITIYTQLKYEVQIFSKREKTFKYLTLSMMFPLVLEALTWMVNGYPGRAAWVIHVVLDVLLFMSNIFPLAIWTYYIILTINPKKKDIFIKYIPVIILVTINIYLAITTPITNKFFVIDANNIYHRGEWIMVSNGIFALLFMYDLLLVVSNWKKINQRERIPMLFFLLPPLIGFIFQMRFYGTSLIWPGCTISVLVVYIMIQSQIVKTDYLTGLYNRRQLDFYLNRKIASLTDSKRFAGIMIDLDDFKLINDQYGHSMGDEALRSAATLINKSFYRDVFIARYGGDEFTVLMNMKDEKELDDKIKILKNNFELFNQKNKKKYKLKISLGYSIYTSEYGNASIFLEHLDGLMYKDKKERKSKSLLIGGKQTYDV